MRLALVLLARYFAWRARRSRSFSRRRSSAGTARPSGSSGAGGPDLGIPTFVLPADSGIYTVRAGLRAAGMPPDLFPEQALEVSLWHEASYRDTAGRFGLPDRPQETNHFTQKTRGPAGGIFTPWLDHTVSLFLTGGVAERTDVLSVFPLGGPLWVLSEFPLILQGYNDCAVYRAVGGVRGQYQDSRGSNPECPPAPAAWPRQRKSPRPLRAGREPAARHGTWPRPPPASRRPRPLWPRGGGR